MLRRVLPITDELALFDLAQTRLHEHAAASSLPPHTLMRRAGESVARLVLAVAPHARNIWIAAGPGNNGGDGIEAAIHLIAGGKQVEVSLLGDAAKLPADAADALRRAQSAGVKIGQATAPVEPPQLAIDALLGVGANRAPEGAPAAGIGLLKTLACPVLAVDIPSGLHAQTGQPLGANAVSATHTLALLGLKPGLFTGTGRDHAGVVWLDTLGTSAIGDEPFAWLAGVRLPTKRHHAQHKGSFGDVAVVGGAPGMSGAALVAARAAHAAGAGRVYVALLDATPSAPRFDVTRPELMFRNDWLESDVEVFARTTVVCGCGGADAVRRPLPRVLGMAQRLVLDADALNAIANDPSLAHLLQARGRRGLGTVLTPHPLEAARLLGCKATEVQADRLRAANRLTERFGCVVVLKGSGTVIAAPSQTPRVNSTGNAALATAGTGDVLAGWLGGRWAAHQVSGDAARVAFSAACHAVAEHGAAAEPQPAGALRAGDLIERLYGA